ncbi:MAG TPA: trypsin-like peptidase domain-containing protein, partial [Thermomicrobiales bacterium]|nr:trypsin-like peptidase domain-containing protein [Thermomicrobiales bacterium]
ASANPANSAVMQTETTPAASQDAMSAVDVVKMVSPAVVTVINEQKVSTQDGTSSIQPVGSGTGFIIDTDGHIVTNWHVVDGGSKFEVIFSDGTTATAKLVGSDSVSDIAVVKVEGDVPGTIAFGDSDALLPGESVLAMGSPLGDFQNTVTEGIVSATNRDFPGAAGSNAQYNNLIQHDAAINPGNSGGPLLNMSGEVVGVNTLGISVDDNGQPVQGLFFAIPSNSVEKVVGQLIDSGTVTYPYVGISFTDNSATIAAQNNLSISTGVVVMEVPAGGPADAAGVQAGDVITKVGDYELNAQTTFSEALFNYKPGDKVDLEINRGGKSITVTITLGERPANINQ